MSIEDKYRRELRKICQENKRYEPEAYLFVQQGVSYATKRIFPQKKEEERQHISGQQLVGALRDFALERYGPLALEIMHEWGIRSTEDFGEIVFILVNHGLLGASDEDSPDDFRNCYEFAQAFSEPFAAKEEVAGLPPIE